MIWLSKDSNKIQPFGAHKIQYRVRLCEHLESLHDQRIRSQAAQNTHMRDSTGDQEMQGGDRGGRYANAQGNYPGGDHSDPEDDSEDDDQDLANA